MGTRAEPLTCAVGVGAEGASVITPDVPRGPPAPITKRGGAGVSPAGDRGRRKVLRPPSLNRKRESARIPIRRNRSQDGVVSLGLTQGRRREAGA